MRAGTKRGLQVFTGLPRGLSTEAVKMVDQGAIVKQCTLNRMRNVEVWHRQTGIATTLFLRMRLCTTESAEV